jgi:hypothetical protein
VLHEGCAFACRNADLPHENCQSLDPLLFTVLSFLTGSSLMLKSLDVLIGLTVIMLALSMGVTMLTQFATTVLNSRGRHLKRGIVDVLNQIDPALAKKAAETEESFASRIAEAVLTHPLISATGRRLGTVVHREELTRLLIYFADDDADLEAGAKAAWKGVLARNGIVDPAGTLKKIRDASMKLETVNPGLAVNVRQTMAILQEASSDFVAKINNSFDQAIDRVSQRFTTHARAVTFVAGLLIAGALQVDTIGLVNRLSADDMLRQAFVSTAVQQTVLPDATEVSAGAIDRQYMSFLAENGLVTAPRSRDEWLKRWSQVNPVGVLVTTLLLSLGAPFWYNALGQLLQLRSVLAVKDDQQRAARQNVDGKDGANP